MITPEKDLEPVKTVSNLNLGHVTPRVHTPLREDLPSKGQEMIDFCKKIGWPLLPWQEWLAIQAHRYHPETNRWANPTNVLCISRQNGKSTFMALRILTGMFLWDEKMQVGTAHKLTTSSEIFYKVFEIIESNPELSSQFAKKIESKGSQELRTLNGNRYLIRANNASGRGIAAVDVIHMDEVREYTDTEVWASMKYSQMSSKNPMTWVYSSAGDQHSVILNNLRERAYAAIAGSEDSIGWFEWSGIADVPLDPNDEKFWESIRMANPSLGHTIHPDNIRDVLGDDETTIRTEVLTTWVSTINPIVSAPTWNNCENSEMKLDREAMTWMGIDLSPDRKSAALVGAQQTQSGEGFVVALLNTWTSPTPLDDKFLANQISEWVRKYHTEVVAYSSRTSSAVAARLKPAGIPIAPIDGSEYAQACDEFLGAVNSGRLIHLGQPELTKQILSAVKLPYGDGGWVMGRKVSNATIAAAVATSFVTHYATREAPENDIVVI